MTDKGPLAEINNVIIRFILDLYHGGEFEALENMGVTKSTALELSELSARNSQKLSKCQQMLGDVFIDEKRLKRLIQYVIHNDAKDSFINQLIKMKASQSMLERLAGIDHHDYRQRRNLLDLPEASSGRPTSLSRRESVKLIESWQHHSDKADDLLQRYFYVGIDTGISLSRIWHYMQSYGSDCHNVLEHTGKRQAL